MRNKERFRFWGIVGLGLLIRILYAFWLGDSWMSEDAGGYYQDAIWILEGKTISPFWPPGVPYYLAAFMWILGPSPVVAMMGMMVWYVGFCWSFLGVAKHWLQTNTIHILLIGFAIYPAFVHHSVAPLSHLPVAVCLLLCLLLILRIQAFSSTTSLPLQMFSLIGMGGILGLMGLFRPGALLLIPVFVVSTFLIIRSTFSYAWARALIPLLIGCMIVGGWEISLFQQHQRWVGINDASAMNLFIGNNPQTPLYKTWFLGSHDETRNPAYAEFYETRSRIRALPMAKQKAAFSQEACRHIQDQPDLFVLRTLNRLRCFFAFDTYTGARALEKTTGAGILFLVLDALCYLLLGYLAISSWRESNISPFYSSLFVWIIFGYSIPYLLAFSHPTYHFAILPLIGMMAGKGIESRKHPRDWSLWQKVGIAIFCLIQIEWVAFMMT